MHESRAWEILCAVSKEGVLCLVLHAQEPWGVHAKWKLESNQIRGFTKEEGLERSRARGVGSLRKLLHSQTEAVVPESGETWGGFEGCFGEE